MKKKIISLLMVMLFAIGFVACGVKTTEAPTTETPTTLTPTTETPTTVAPTTEAPTTVDLAPTFIGVQDREITEDDVTDVLDAITAVDDLDGDITENIVVTTDFDYEVPGVYTVELSVTDSGDNTTTASFVITVVERVLTPEEKVSMALNEINLTYPNLTLPKFTSYGVSFTWTTSNPRVISSSGYVINPSVGQPAAVVELTVRASSSGYVESKTFELTIPANEEVTVTDHVTLPFEGTSTEYVVADNPAVDLFYVDNGSVQYVDVQTFLNLIDGAIESDILEYIYPEADVLRVSYDVTYLDIDGVTEVTETYYAEINFTENTFTVNNFDFFGGYIASTESNYGEGLNYVDADFVEGNEVVIPLGFYNFDLVIHTEGEQTYYLMPLAVANRLFAGDIYYDVYYNGDKLWGIDTFVIPGNDDPALITQIQTSSLNTADAPRDMKLATYHYLAFVMDYFYGLKPDKGYETYYDKLYASAKTIIEGTDSNLYSQVFKLAYGLDDLHTSYLFDGYWNAPRVPGLSLSDLGLGTVAFYEYFLDIQDRLDAKYGSYNNMPTHTLLDNETVAVIHITGFTIDTPNEFKAIMDSLPSTVTDVVIDLSYNTGGNVGAVMRIFGYMTEEQYMYHSQNPADGSAVTYYIESDYVAYDKNWYVLTSGVTFSAANLFASMAKELGIPVIGQQSSGGACSIGVVMNPDGSAIMISTNNVLSTRSGNEIDGYTYTSVEGGVPVDRLMTDVTSDNELVNVINYYRANAPL